MIVIIVMVTGMVWLLLLRSSVSMVNALRNVDVDKTT